MFPGLILRKQRPIVYLSTFLDLEVKVHPPYWHVVATEIKLPPQCLLEILVFALLLFNDVQNITLQLSSLLRIKGNHRTV